MILKFSIMNFLRIALLATLIGPKYAYSQIPALSEMEELLDTEAHLIKNLEDYILAQERKVEILKRKVNEYQKESTKAAADTDYLLNPINAFLLTKRLNSDWKLVEKMMDYEEGTAFFENITEFRETLRFPSEEDLNGAAVALMTLQDTYNLPTAEIARGELNGIQYSSEMTLSDCFELGRQSYLNEDYYHTKLWMNEAMTRLPSANNKTSDDVSREEILEYLAFSVYQQGDVVEALRFTNELLVINPNHELAKSNKDYFVKEIIQLEKIKKGDNSEAIRMETIKNDRKIYEKLCRGEIQPTAAQLRPLCCSYVTHQNAFLKLAPFKMEEVSQSPYIVIYHNVMYDKEIDYLKKSTQSKMRRPKVKHAKTGKWETARIGSSKLASIKDTEHRYIAAITQRAADITNLNMKTAESLQIVNYGIGGQFEPYFDFDKMEDITSDKGPDTGKRIATLIFTMSDIGQGGSTVFPGINLAISPGKGSAAFWYNFYASGEADNRTRYAVCPVLKGTKWISNKWAHEHGQEFRRPCQQFPDHPVTA